MRQCVAVLGLLVVVSCTAPGAAGAQAAPASVPEHTGELIVAFEPAASGAERAAARADAGVDVVRSLGIEGSQLVRPEPGIDFEAAAAALRADPQVRYVAPDGVMRVAATLPNDPFFVDGRQWNLHNMGTTGGTEDADIDAPEAWDVTTGAAYVTVAVVDTGVDANHPDFSGRVLPGHNVITSGGGTGDGHGHGTHMTGIIAASGNNALGIAGVSWRTTILPVKAFDDDGSGSASAALAALDYAATHAAVVNASFVGTGAELRQPFTNVVQRHPDTLFVFSAGDGLRDIETAPVYPCAVPGDNVICVTATDPRDVHYALSNFGATRVDLGAPGVNIHSTWKQGTFQALTGTSTSTAHVSGAAALVLAPQAVRHRG